MSQTHQKRAVALLSAGLDSTVSLLLAKQDGWDIQLAITFDYGQRAAVQENSRAAYLAMHYGVPHQSISLPWFAEFKSGGALLNRHEALPNPDASELSDTIIGKTHASQVWVPNRNGVMVEIAAAFAEDLGASAVIVGFNKEEAATFPDNSKDYLDALNRSLSFSTQQKVQVVSPTLTWDKVQIVKVATDRNLPLHLLWSCYENRDKMCGLCESCMRLKRSLKENEVSFESYFEDPLY